MSRNVGARFDRLPPDATAREVDGRATREGVLDWWEDRFGVPRRTFDGYTFWEKGAGKIWILHGDRRSPIEVEALGLRFMHTRQKYWKPTTNAVQRFGNEATRNVLDLPPDQAARFVEGDEQPIPWEGEWGYLICTRVVAGAAAPIGVGLYTHGTLRSQIPKGRRMALP